MSYIGQRPVVGRYIKLDQISSGFNGSNTSFSMTAGSQAVSPGTARNMLVSLGGVIQEPDTNFTVSGSTLTFTTAPVANTTFFAVIFGDMQSTGTPSDGTVLPASIASSGNFSFPQLTVTGTSSLGDDVTFTGANYNVLWDKSDNALEFADNAKARFGSSNDLQIYHDGTASFITNTTGGLNLNDTGGYFRVKSDDIKLEAANGEDFLECDANGAVSLYYDASKKFETTSTGANVTSANDAVLKVTTTGTASTDDARIELITQESTFIIQNDRSLGTDGALTIGDGTDTYLQATKDAEIGLYFDNSKKFETTSLGAQVTGRLNVSGNFEQDDNVKANWGNSHDLQIYHNGTTSIIDSTTTNLDIQSSNTINIKAADESSVVAHANGAVELYYDASKKLHTTTSGIQVEGAGIFQGPGGNTTTLQLKNATDTSGTLIGHSSNSNAGFLQVTESNAGLNIQVGGANTGNLKFQCLENNGNTQLVFGTEKALVAVPNGTVELYHDNSKKLETTSSGIDVTGRVTTDELSVVKTSGNLSANFEAQSGLGTLEIGGSTGAFIDLKTPFSDDFDLRIDSSGTLTSGGNIQLNVSGSENGVRVLANGAVELYHDNSKKLETTTNGIFVTGSMGSTPVDKNSQGMSLNSYVVDINQDAQTVATAKINSNKGVCLDLNRFYTTGNCLDFRINNDYEGGVSVSPSGVSYTTTSDYRVKENVVALSDGITKLKQLKPYRFNFIAEPSVLHDGFFAHEVTPVVPTAVSGEQDATEIRYYEEGDILPSGKVIGDVKDENSVVPQTLDYSKLVPLLTAALQEAIAKIEVLETKVAALEAA